MHSVLDGNLYAIFAQAPVENVVEHFWAACYHHKVRRIIMLCSFEDPNRGVPPSPRSNRPRSTGQNSGKALTTPRWAYG